MATTDTYICLNCRKDFTARTADRRRGWARFCCKSCKAKQMTPHMNGRRVTHVVVDEYGSVANGAYHDFDDTHPFSGDALEP